MAEKKRARQLHPQGPAPGETEAGHRAVRTVETYSGPVRLRWDPDAAVTACGQRPYFIEFLQTAGLFEAAAITTRPLLLHGIARRTRHGHQTTVTIKSLHARARPMKAALQAASAFLARVRATAEQLTRLQRWRLILSWIFRHFLRGRIVGSTSWVTEAI